MIGIWDWFTSVPNDGQWSVTQSNALVAIAGVAAIVWTGGLIAYQIKEVSIENIAAQDMLQFAFMAAIFGLFMQAEAIRIVATLFTLLYTIQSLVSVYVTRDVEQMVSHYKSEATGKQVRGYAFLTLLSMLAYVAIIVWPNQTAIAWSTAFTLLVGLQMTIHRLYGAPDKARIA